MEEREKDKYDLAIEKIRNGDRCFPESREGLQSRIIYAWERGSPDDPVGCLFQFCSPNGHFNTGRGGLYGCLTMVKGGQFVAFTPELTEEIQKDERIPSLLVNITNESLEVFAEWQRRLDREIRSLPTPDVTVDAYQEVY